MSAAARAQLGFKAESVYGTAVTVDRFLEFNKEAIKLVPRRTESQGLRSAHRAMRSDRHVPWYLGARGPVTLEVLTKGFGVLFQHLLGAVATGSTTDSKTIHTASVGNMKGVSGTWQINRPFHPADTDQAFTYEGGKVAGGKLYNSVDGLLMLDLDLDFEDEATGTALASASYPTSTQPFSWAGGAVTIGGSSVDLTEIEITIDNGLKTDDLYLRASTLKKEPQEAKLRDIAWKAVMDFDSLTQMNRWKSLVAATNIAAIVGTWTGPVLIGSSSFPTCVATMPAARLDGDTPTVDGPGPLQQTLQGKGLFDGTNSPLSVAYGTADATP